MLAVSGLATSAPNARTGPITGWIAASETEKTAGHPQTLPRIHEISVRNTILIGIEIMVKRNVIDN